MAIFEGKKSSNDIRINNTMSDDEVVASAVLVPCESVPTDSDVI